jgi:hypothetical protein
MKPGAVKSTQQLGDLGQSRSRDNITGGLLSSQTHGLYIGDLAVTARTAAMQARRQEK